MQSAVGVLGVKWEHGVFCRSVARDHPLQRPQARLLEKTLNGAGKKVTAKFVKWLGSCRQLQKSE